jgi:hypothetical protein
VEAPFCACCELRKERQLEDRSRQVLIPCFLWQQQRIFSTNSTSLCRIDPIYSYPDTNSQIHRVWTADSVTPPPPLAFRPPRKGATLRTLVPGKPIESRKTQRQATNVPVLSGLWCGRSPPCSSDLLIQMSSEWPKFVGAMEFLYPTPY